MPTTSETPFLLAQHIEKRAKEIKEKIGQQFPEREGLEKRALQLEELIAGIEALKTSLKRVRQRRDLITTLFCLLTASMLGFTLFSGMVFTSSLGIPIDFVEGITALDATTNLLILLFLAIVTINNLHNRSCEAIIHRYLNQLHHFVHILDMHQAAKPFTSNGNESKTHMVTPNYLLAIGDLIALTGKLPALVATLWDSDGVAASSERLEQLCLALNQKLWTRLDLHNRKVARPLKVDAAVRPNSDPVES